MNTYLIIAGITAIIASIGHSIFGEWIGERVLVARISRLELLEDHKKDDLAKRVLRLSWHCPSIAWFGVVGILFYMATLNLSEPMIIILRTFSLIFFASLLLSLATARGRHISWVLFSVVSICTWLGAVN